MRWRVLSIIGILYIVQFIPLFFVVIAVPIVLRQEGHSGAVIGIIQLAGFPYIFKFLWAPLIDKYKLSQDRYKSWIALLSVLHVSGLVWLSFTEPTGGLTLLFFVLLFTIFAVSTQDVAVDALSISLLRPSERALGATFQNLGAYTGAIIGGFGFLYLYATLGWQLAILIQAVIFLLPLSALLLIAEPERRQGGPAVTLRNALRFFTQPNIVPWLAVLSTMRLPLMTILLPMRLMLVDQGMTTEEIAVWFGLFAMGAGGGATAIFGPMLRNLPRVQALYLVGLLNIPVLIGIAFIASQMPEAIRYALIVSWVAIAMTDVVMFRGAMDRVRPEMPGFDFSAQIALFMMLPGIADPISGFVMDTYGVAPVFLAAIPLTLIPLAFLYFGIASIRNSAFERHD